jgi:LmbE family N-acetylglucosaminyl deacetylase
MPAFYSPLGLDPTAAKKRTRALAIGAHPDDIEFMCLDPIIRHRNAGRFGGLIVTSGSGSLRAPQHAALSPSEYAELRWEEQKQAAKMGGYAFVDSLNIESSVIKTAAGLAALATQLREYLVEFEIDELYMHQPFDRHASHVRVAFAVLTALRSLPKERRPAQVLGCEVWRNLDWAPKSSKVLRPLSAADLELQVRLAEVFTSQADPKNAKDYVAALVGRKTANAVFQEGLVGDSGVAQEVYIDLKPWVESKLNWSELGREYLGRFQQEATSAWPQDA